jgi:hypothetical protein
MKPYNGLQVYEVQHIIPQSRGRNALRPYICKIIYRYLRDFQKLNSSSCGVGILPALSLGRAGCPSHKKILRIFLFASP